MSLILPAPSFAPLPAQPRTVPRGQFTIDFLNRTITKPGLLDFSRSTVATRTDEAGVLQTEAVDVPRGWSSRDHEATSPFSARGLLTEGPRTNLIWPSEDFDHANWTKSAGGTGIAPVVTPDFAASPIAGVNATRIECNKGAGTTSNDISHMTSVQASLADPHDVSIALWMKLNTGTSEVVYFDNASGLVGVTVTDSWQRFERTETGQPFAFDRLLFGLRGGVTPATPDTIDLLVAGAQMEAAPFASSYIATTTAQATRNADNTTISDVSAWLRQGRGTLLVEGDISGPVPSGTNFHLFSLHSGTIADRVMIRGQAAQAGLELIFNVRESSVGQAAITTTFAVATRFKALITYNTNDVRAFKDGVKIGADAAATIPTNLTTLDIGHELSAQPMFGHINNFRYFPFVLTDDQAIAVSTL